MEGWEVVVESKSSLLKLCHKTMQTNSYLNKLNIGGLNLRKHYYIYIYIKSKVSTSQYFISLYINARESVANCDIYIYIYVCH